METLNLQQGSDEWLSVRSKHFTASEAPAMLGLSKYQSRDELLRQKATGYSPDVDAAKQRLFDRGHEAEAAARALVEGFIGDELYPATGVEHIDGLPLLASFDGITMSEGIVWENKLWNAALAADIEAGVIGDHYWPQLEQQLLVSGAEQAYFTASDGTVASTVGMWYRSVPKRRQKLIAGWKQFAEDLANYQPVEVIPAAVATPIKELPALNVQIIGNVVASNLAEWKSVVTARIDAINTDLQNDQDFADAGDMVKFLDDGEKKIDLVKSQAQSQASDIDTVFRALDDIKASMRTKRLELNRLVEARKVSIRAEILQEGKTKLAAHIADLNKRLARAQMPAVKVDFEGAMRAKKSLASLREAVNNEFLRAKLEANDIADKIQINLATLDEQSDYEFLFSDRASLAMKAPDDLQAVISNRITAHKAEQQKKLDDAREQIRKEEEAKAAQKVKDDAEKARLAAETKATEVVAETQSQQPIATTTMQALETNTPPSGNSAPVPENAPVPVREPGRVSPVLSDKNIADANARAFVESMQSSPVFFKTQALVAYLDDNQFTPAEIDLVQHYAERIVIDRKAAA